MITASTHRAQPRRWQELWREAVTDPREPLAALDLEAFAHSQLPLGRSPSAAKAMDGREGPAKPTGGRERPPGRSPSAPEAMDGREGLAKPTGGRELPPGRSPSATDAMHGRERPQADVGGFPIRMPRSLVARMRCGDPADPLLLRELSQRGELGEVPALTPDWVGDLAASTANGVLRKYEGRALLVGEPGKTPL
jgi:hypothetical protein